MQITPEEDISTIGSDSCWFAAQFFAKAHDFVLMSEEEVGKLLTKGHLDVEQIINNLSDDTHNYKNGETDFSTVSRDDIVDNAITHSIEAMNTSNISIDFTTINKKFLSCEICSEFSATCLLLSAAYMVDGMRNSVSLCETKRSEASPCAKMKILKTKGRLVSAIK